MREIKFRGRSLSGGWVVGDLHHSFGHPYISQDTDHGPNHFQVDPETIGQFTGLKDKNGTEIFEGDILGGVNLSNNNPVVFECKYFDQTSNGFSGTFRFNGWLWDDLEQVDHGHCFALEVIGKIYENGELLEQPQVSEESPK